jgi:F-type H+-transporting ATPase subunit b
MTRVLLLLLLLTAPWAAHADSMPQLDFGNKLLTSQVVWGAIIFGAFYYLAANWGLPRVGAILDMRARTIEGDLEQARIAKQTADKAVAELNEARRVAHAESQKALAEAAATAKQEADARAAEVNARLDKQLAESEAQIEAARAASMRALGEVAVETAGDVIGRVTGRGADTGRVRAAVNELLQARGLAGVA